MSLNNVEVSSWTVTHFSNFTHPSWKAHFVALTNEETGKLVNGPQGLSGTFNVPGKPLDTYINTSNWGKGIAIVNNHNIGRYWPSIGPQVTLYVPAQYLKQGENSLTLFELEYVPKNRSMSFQTEPLLDYP